MDRPIVSTPPSRDNLELQSTNVAESLDRLSDVDGEADGGWSDDEWETDAGEEWESGEGDGDAEEEEDGGSVHRRTRSWPWSVERGSEGERTVSDSEDDDDDDEAVSAELCLDVSSVCSQLFCHDCRTRNDGCIQPSRVHTTPLTWSPSAPPPLSPTVPFPFPYPPDPSHPVPSCFQPDGSSDTSARQAARGRDIQGIPWERLQWTREKYRTLRLQQYKNYQNLSVDLEQLASVSAGASHAGRGDGSMLVSRQAVTRAWTTCFCCCCCCYMSGAD